MSKGQKAWETVSKGQASPLYIIEAKRRKNLRKSLRWMTVHLLNIHYIKDVGGKVADKTPEKLHWDSGSVSAKAAWRTWT